MLCTSLPTSIYISQLPHRLACPLASLLQADKNLYASLFNAVGAALSAAPDCVPVPLLACLAEAQLLVADKMGGQAPKLPEQVTRKNSAANT